MNSETKTFIKEDLKREIKELEIETDKLFRRVYKHEIDLNTRYKNASRKDKHELKMKISDEWEVYNKKDDVLQALKNILSTFLSGSSHEH